MTEMEAKKHLAMMCLQVNDSALQFLWIFIDTRFSALYQVAVAKSRCIEIAIGVSSPSSVCCSVTCAFLMAAVTCTY